MCTSNNNNENLYPETFFSVRCLITLVGFTETLKNEEKKKWKIILSLKKKKKLFFWKDKQKTFLMFIKSFN